ncbi:hypothetical protein ACFWXO_30900 [Kitasatospora sp. NPDC059088]|uniref:hypothetical protein n=1 Tax=Kitasatospora sp. NPDC059088 TaxID=3346722 RepID=UPI003680D248
MNENHPAALHRLAHEAGSLLPERHGRWRARVGPRNEGTSAVLQDRRRSLRLTVTADGVTLKSLAGTGEALETAVPHRHASARAVAATIARSHLHQPHESEGDPGGKAVAELVTAAAVAEALAKQVGRRGRVAAAVRDRWHVVSWERGLVRGEVRIDDPGRVQVEADGVRFPKLVRAFEVAFPLADAEPSVLARPDAASTLLRRFPELWHDPRPDGDLLLLGPGTGPVTCSVQVPDRARPTRATRGMLTVECPVDLALMILEVLT